MTEGQAQNTLAALGAQYRALKGNVQWYQAADKTWFAVTRDGRGDVRIQRVPANACGC
jgi:hypothetical protein